MASDSKKPGAAPEANPGLAAGKQSSPAPQKKNSVNHSKKSSSVRSNVRQDQSGVTMERTTMLASKMSFAASESYKLLRTNLMFSFSGKTECRCIGMTSSFRGEGKSLTSINLSYTLAEARKNVLLIEADMRLPTFSTRLGLKSAPGLSNLLVGLNSVGEAIQEFNVPLEDGNVVTVDVIVAGDIPPNPSELLSSSRMQTLLSLLRERYDYVIVDLPPVGAVSDALVVSRLVDGTIVVVRNNHAVRGALSDTIRQLRQVDARLLGFVFNGADESNSSYYRGHKYKYYRKGYYKDKYYYYRK